MIESKPPYGKRVKTRAILPKAAPLHEEPIRGIEPGKIVCQICGKIFKPHSQLEKHMEHMHGNPEKTHVE